MKEKRQYIPANLKAYFTQAIEVQRHAFKEGYAKHKLNQSCDTLVRCGFCGSNRDCDKCALQFAHEETLKALKNPRVAYERYLAYNARLLEKNHGVIKTRDKKGHVTLVLHYKKGGNSNEM